MKHFQTLCCCVKIELWADAGPDGCCGKNLYWWRKWNSVGDVHHAETFLFYPRFSCKQSWRRPLDEAANGDDDFIIVLKQAALWVVKCQEALQSISKNWIFHLKRSVNYSGKYNSLLIYGSWRLKIFLLNSPDRKWKKGWNGVKEYWLKRTFRSQLLNRSFIQLFL